VQRAQGLFACLTLALAVRSASAGTGFAEGQIAFTDPITGHARFGAGGAVSGRVGYLYGSSIRIGFLFELDLSYSRVSPKDWSWDRVLFGSRVLVPVSPTIGIAIDGQAGLDYLMSGAYAVQLSAGPRVQCGQHMFVGADVSFVYSHIDQIPESYPDPNGTMIIAGATLGATW
jgi:hypothetical protein